MAAWRRVVIYSDPDIVVETVYVDDPRRAVLELLSSSRRPLTLRDVAERLGVSVKRARMILGELTWRGGVCSDKGLYYICRDANVI